jgi:predicted 3-demethylubiquinone-9 3-methyltransferase (glyoxalase superfamily)
MQKIVTCLGFNNQAGEAVNFYTSGAAFFHPSAARSKD